MSETKNTSRFENYVSETFNKCASLLQSKSNDYSETTNRYSNFEESAKIAGITPEQSILNLIGIKTARLRQLTVNNKDIKHESVDDSIQDLINYALLLGAMKKGLQ